MSVVTRVVGGIVGLLRRTRQEQELDAELQEFLERAIEDKVRAGMSRETATRAARMELGSAAAVKDRVRDVGWENVVETTWQDVRYAARMLRRSPGFTAVAVVSLALGIGANTAIFSLIHALMLRSLPVSHPEQLVEPLSRYPGEPRMNSFSWRHYERMRDHNQSFSDLVAVGRGRFQVTWGGPRAGDDRRRVRRRQLLHRAWGAAGPRPADRRKGRSAGLGERGQRGGQLVVLDEPVARGSRNRWQSDRRERRAGDGDWCRAARLLWTAGWRQPPHVGAGGDGTDDPTAEPPDGRDDERRPDGPLEARRDHRAGRCRDAGTRSVPRRGYGQGEAIGGIDSGHHHRVGAGGGRVCRAARSVRHLTPRADGRGRPAPADRLHQCRQHAAGAWRGEATRNGLACVARRGTPAAGAARPDRVATALCDRRPDRRRAGVGRRRHARAHHLVRARVSEAAAAHRDFGAARSAGAAVHRRRRRVDRRAVRRGSGLARLDLWRRHPRCAHTERLERHDRAASLARASSWRKSPCRS